MPTTYKTPGVYVEEVSAMPPSVAEVSTAIPAFIGYTEKNPSGDNQPIKIATFLEYKELFGGPAETTYTVTVTGDIVDSVTPVISPYQMYYCLDLYFKNGGGPCYIVSTGGYSATVTYDALKAGLDALEKKDEPTLILFPEAVNMTTGSPYDDLYNDVLEQCHKLGDRFGIFDVLDNDTDAAAFRQNIRSETEYLKYGAAYTPYLHTSITHAYSDSGVTVTNEGTLDTIKNTNTAMYNNVRAALSARKVTLPPAAAMAGVYAATDRSRGVWKAPANVNLLSVTGLAQKITTEAQENLNVDATAGKSVNAIREFTGQGILVWGARTLAGNDNNWRYISVRRLFNTVEESCRNSTRFAIFESNDANTWLKVKSMINSYLYGLWQQGALAGATPEEAYFTNIGLGKTMTSQDILEGRMIVEIGLAALRPAEFIILRFSHKLQES